jgi:hypothetical protein
MSKFLLNLLLQISKALVNSKIQFLFEKNFSSEFSPLGPAGQPTPPALACRISQAVQPLPGPNRPAHLASQPLGPCMPLAYFTEDVFLFGSRLLEPVGFSLLTATRAPPVSFIVSPAPVDPGRNFPHAAAPCLGCPRAFTTLPHHSPLLIPFKPSVNGP